MQILFNIIFGVALSAGAVLAFGPFLAKAMKTGVAHSRKGGDIRRDEHPILYWMYIAMLLGWVVGLPIFVMLFAIGVIVP